MKKNVFLSTLTRLGCVEPCGCVDYKHTDGVCRRCGGSSRVFNLAPLMASPRELIEAVHNLIMRHRFFGYCQQITTDEEDFTIMVKQRFPTLQVVGHRDDACLVYEVARKLGVKAVLTDPVYDVRLEDRLPGNWVPVITRHTLSVPLEPESSALFVVGQLGPSTMTCIDTVMAARVNTEGLVILPHLMCLVDSRGETGCGKVPVMMDHRTFEIIALHAEE